MYADAAAIRPELILFAKKPVPGSTKTRLQPPLTPEQAAGVADILLRLSVALARRYWPGDLALAVSPAAEADWWQSFAQENMVPIRGQGTGELGDRMYRALKDAAGPAAVMGCDVPHCPPDVLRRAYDTLARGHNVVGPSRDGGYYLIGVQRARASLFNRIDWGSPRVMAQTLVRAGMEGIFMHCLPELRDLDRWEDIVATRHRLPALDHFLEQAGIDSAGATPDGPDHR